MVLPALSHAQLTQICRPAQLGRAMAAVDAGHVRQLAVDAHAGCLEADVVDDVAGSLTCHVTAWLRASARRVTIAPRCTCEASTACSHILAALVAYSRLSAAALQSDSALPTGADAAPDVADAGTWQRPRGDDVAAVGGGTHAAAGQWSFELDRWLTIAEKALTPPPARLEHPAGVTQRLIYVLRHPLPSMPSQTEVRLMLARLRKSGGIGQPTLWRNAREALRQPPRFVTDADLRLLRRLLVDARDTIDGYLLEGERASEVLQELLASGRCYAECSWRGRDLKLLHAAPQRLGHAAWRFRTNGTQDFGCETDPPSDRVLALAPPWYIDLTNGECGPVKTGLPPDLAAALLRAPAVAPAQVDTVRAELNARLGARAAALPQPQPVHVEHRRDVEPVPVLRLWTHVPAPHGVGHEAMEVASLHFEYEGERVRFHDTGDARIFRAGRLLQVARNRQAEMRAVAQLRSAGLLPLGRGDLTADRESAAHTLPSGRWLAFMRQQVPVLQAAGFRIDIDADFRYRLAEAGRWFADLRPAGADWFELGLGVEIGDQQVDLLPILTAMLAGKRKLLAEIAAAHSDGELLVRLDDGRMLPVPYARLRPIVSILNDLFDDADARPRLSRLDAERLLAAESAGAFTWRDDRGLRELGQRLAHFDGIASVPVPLGLHAQLRPYQAAGLSWMQFLRSHELNGVLADDMGLGKTVQALAHVLVEKESGRLDRPVLVVAPTSVLPNWQAETARFAPGLKVHVWHGHDRHASAAQLADADLVLTTYPLLARDRSVLEAQPFHLVILDEAQQIKNAQTQAAVVVAALNARHRLCLTGTPIENNLGELWSQFRFLMPGFLGDARTFRRIYRTPIEKHADELRRLSLARRLRPFILRRTKAEVEASLPPRTDIVQRIELQRAQRDLYETVRVAMHERVRREIAARGMGGSHIIVLDALLKLRQICCDPRLLKLERAHSVNESAKLTHLLAMLEALLAEGRRVLLFSQFTSMLALIRAELDARQLRYVELTGDTRDRRAPVVAFQAGEVPLFLISLKAGGTGLNLTAADTVIHYDPWWNPAVESQATDRAHRIGQDKPVFVYRLIVAGSVEERISALQASKAALAAAILDGDGARPQELGADDIAALFEPLPTVPTGAPRRLASPLS